MFTLLLLCLAGPALGQAAFNSERVQHGGFIAPVLKLSTVNEEAAQLLGFRAGWIVNLEGGHSLIFGGGAYGLLNDINARGVSFEGMPVRLGLDYAGLELGYRHHTFSLVHFGVETLVGAGGVGYRDTEEDFAEDDGDGFFVVEPGVSMTLNLVRFLRINGGVTYRYARGVSLLGTTNEDLTALAGTIAIQVGRF